MSSVVTGFSIWHHLQYPFIFTTDSFACHWTLELFALCSEGFYGDEKLLFVVLWIQNLTCQIYYKMF